MAGYVATGTLYIELVDFLAVRGLRAEGIKTLSVDRDDGALVLAYDGDSPPQRLDLDDLWMWVFENHFPISKYEEVAFGVPRFSDGDLVLDFATSSFGHPSNWEPQPEAVLQWNTASMTAHRTRLCVRRP